MPPSLKNTFSCWILPASRQTAEHVSGTLKAWMGSTHFLMKRLPNVQTEMSLHVLAYKLKRAMQIFGVVPLIKAIRA